MGRTTVLGGDGYPPELVASVRRATEAAAMASREWFGRGDKDAADGAAVAAMRAVLKSAPFDGTVVIGEGEKDAAPMLANGERLGAGTDTDTGEGAGGPEFDIAVDPLDGTRLVAEGEPGSIAVIALAPRGTMFDPRDVFYMDKLIADRDGIGVLDIRNPVRDNLDALAAAKGRAVTDLVVVVLDKPRQADLLAEIREAGASIRLVAEGDVVGAVAAATPGSAVDLAIGIGGTPEGVITACAVRALGGFMHGRLAPQTPDQTDAALAAGHDLARVLELDDLVGSSDVLFVSTEI